MKASYHILSKIFQTLDADKTLKDTVTGIYTQAQMPREAHYPVLLVFIRNAFESPAVGTLTDTFVDFVARSKSADGEGSELATIFERADSLVNGVNFKETGEASGRPTRRGLAVDFGVFDEDLKDYFKRWAYRIIVRQLSS
jgi:hypothetical protein